MITYELITRNKFNILDYKFNVIAPMEIINFNYFDKLRDIFYSKINFMSSKSYFIHFTGKSFLGNAISNKIEALNKKYFD